MQPDTMNALSDQKVAVLAASGTVASGLASHFDLIEGTLSIIALVVGIILSIVLTWKHYKEIKLMDERAKTRRKGDKCDD
jgi:hypothetical protein